MRETENSFLIELSLQEQQNEHVKGIIDNKGPEQSTALQSLCFIAI